MTKMIPRPLTFVKDLNIKTLIMKTKATYPEMTRTAKTILIAALFFAEATLKAGDSSVAKKDSDNNHDANITGTELPKTLKAENAFYYLNEVADEPEMEIEEWMYNVHYDYTKSAPEEEIELEEWMCNTQHPFWLDLSDAVESEPAIESWMINPNAWKNISDEFLLTSK
jgi:hypothetical protein